MKELEILQNKETREQMINKVEVLEKVKDLLLLGDSDFATTQQVANYYEVDSDTINWQYNNNKDEFISDGLKILKGKETKAFLATESISVTNFRGYFVADNQKFNNNHNVLFTKRSILRMGINIKARNKKSGESYINTLTEEETFQVEKIVRTWANQVGIDIESNLSLAM